MTQSKRIAVCILRHLKSELSSALISDESKESLEVAIQCLESVYEVGPDDMAALAVTATLPDMFTAATGNERMCFKPAQPTSAEAATPKPNKEPNPEAEAAKARGNELLKAEKYSEALEMYSKAIDLDPNNAVYFCNRAAAFSKLEKSSEAIEDCQVALSIDPTYSKAYGRMGIAYASTGDHQKALECYEKALEHDPSNESYKNNLRVAREQLGQGSGANAGATPAAGLGGLPGGLGGLAGALGGGGGAGGMPDFSQLLGNPALMNMATQIMQDPGMQNLMTNIMSGTMNAGQQQPPAAATAAAPENNGGAGNAAGAAPAGFSFDNLLRAGQQFAQQMQSTNAPLIEQLRREMETRGVQPPNRDNAGNPPANDQNNS